MLDDEVQYIGTRMAQRASSVSDSPNRPVTGLSLHVEKSGLAAAYTLAFQKANSSVVQIGRRPGIDGHEYDPGKAMFRCPVVSRKHAKITFTDAGSVYLFDLGSHHGTHVRKPDEYLSRMLKPESPCMLAGGEFVTLGKSVGKGDDLVRPVVFRVEFHYAPSSPVVKLIDLTRTASSERQLSPADKPSPPKSSGRYGLNDSSSPSSDEMSSSSYVNDYCSDIEENPSSPPSRSRCTPLLDITHSTSHIDHALEVLRGLIPPIHPPLQLRRSQSPSGEHSPLFVFPPMHVPAWNSFNHRPRLPTSPPFDLPPLVQSSDKASEISDWNKLYADGVDEHVAKNRSRSNSPMDLASPSPDPSNLNGSDAPEPNVVGAWPNSPRASSAVPSISSLYVECGTTPFVDEVNNVSNHMPSAGLPVPEKATDKSTTEEHDYPMLDRVRVEKFADFMSALDNLKGDVTLLHKRQDEVKTGLCAQIDTLVGKLADFGERVKDLEYLESGVADARRSSDANSMDVQGLQSELLKLQDDFQSFVNSNASTAESQHEVELLGERQDVKESIETLRQLVQEMKTLRDKTQQQMTSELDTVKAARLAALTSIQEMEALSAQNQNFAVESLKRKRDDEGESGESGEQSAPAEGTMAESVIHSSTIRPGAERAPKRARKGASTFFRTTTAIALGAVATWSALAYS
ncbi:hypothetical protein APHAL10511_003064 [Amanita phalloides]|nr:hypothetical protein APHAL10511_003064 [Amanita phalloides]